MKKNIGKADKVIRILGAIILLTLYFSNTVSGILGIVFLVISVMFIITSFISFCPLYIPFRISTLKKNKN